MGNGNESLGALAERAAPELGIISAASSAEDTPPQPMMGIFTAS